MMNETDRDLLLTFKAEASTKLDRVILDVAKLNDNVDKRVTDLEHMKASREEFEEEKEDKEKRVRSLEQWRWIMVGTFGVIQFILGYYLIKHFGNTPL